MAVGFSGGTNSSGYYTSCVLLLDADRRSASTFDWASYQLVWNNWVALSPDASMLAFAATSSDATAYRITTSTKTGRQLRAIGPLNPSTARSLDPIWSPDGEFILFIGDTPDPEQPGSLPMQRMNADGSGVDILAARAASRPALSPDGQRIAYSVAGSRLALADANGNYQRLLTAAAPAGTVQYGPWWSPDGLLIAYVQRRGPNDGQNQPPYDFDIRVVGADGAGDHLVHRISMASYLGDVFPIWSPDGFQIAFNDGESVVIVDADGQNQRVVLGPSTESAYGPPSWVP